MATITPAYQSPVTMTFAFNGLAGDNALLAGRASTSVDNSTDLAVDAMVGGKIVTTATTVTNTQIQIWAYGSYDGTIFSGGSGAIITGTDGAATLNTGAKNLLKLLTVIPNITTTAITYQWGPISIAQAFGGTMPVEWGLWIVHSTNQVLASGNETKYTPVKYTSA